MAHITIDDIDPLITYAVGASRSVFPVPFAYFENANLVVTVGTDELTLNTEYTVSGTAVDAGFSSGTVTLLTAVTNTTVTIERILPIERTTDFPNSGPFSIPALNTQFDKIIAMIQQIASQVTALGQRLTDWIALFTTLINADTTVTLFETLAAYRLATVGAGVTHIRTAGRNTVGDGGHGFYKVISAPSPVKAWHEVSANGKYIVLVPEAGEINPATLGVVADGTTDNALTFQACIDFAAAINDLFTGGTIILPPGDIHSTAGFVGAHPITIRGHGPTLIYVTYGPAADIGGTRFTFPAGFTGTALTFHTKGSVNLSNFGIVLEVGSTTANGILIDNHDGDATYAYVGNVHSMISRTFIRGGSIQYYMQNCAAYDFCHNFGIEGRSRGLVLENDGTGAPFPIIDGGDGRVHSNVFWSTTALTVAGSCGILMRTHSGTAIGPNNKLLGFQISYGYDAHVVGVAGENNLHNNNIEAFSVNGVRSTQAIAGAFHGGLNVVFNHFNGGAAGAVLVQNCIAFVIGSGGNYVFRGKIIGNDILYSNAVVGGAAIGLATGFNMVVKNNTAQIPADNTFISTSGDNTGTTIEDNGPIFGPTQIYGGLLVDTKVIDLNNGIPAAQLAAWANGSFVYSPDATVNSVPLAAFGTGGFAKRLAGAWRCD